MTAALSAGLLRYGAVATRVFSAAVMVMRPRDFAPVPRYCVIVIEAGFIIRAGTSFVGIRIMRELTVCCTLDACLPVQMSLNPVCPWDDLPELRISSASRIL